MFKNISLQSQRLDQLISIIDSSDRYHSYEIFSIIGLSSSASTNTGNIIRINKIATLNIFII
ncbi:hypothetical protein HOA93_07340 [bacterium]|nr:hypothetical protein [bacterium]